MATKEDIESLKRIWCLDPCWDIEDTTGFEDHKEELLSYRLAMESEWAARQKEKEHNRAVALGIEDHPQLVKYIMLLEYKLNDLNERLQRLEEKH